MDGASPLEEERCQYSVPRRLSSRAAATRKIARVKLPSLLAKMSCTLRAVGSKHAVSLHTRTRRDELINRRIYVRTYLPTVA